MSARLRLSALAATPQFFPSQAGVDAWTEKPLTASESDKHVVIYASFGTTQERYVFGNRDNAEAFKKQYPVRVHKNCYNRTCLDCDLCLKKYSGEDETILHESPEVAAQRG